MDICLRTVVRSNNALFILLADYKERVIVDSKFYKILMPSSVAFLKKLSVARIASGKNVMM